MLESVARTHLDFVKENFEIRFAETAEERHQAYRLRYQVYCLERGFEPGQNGLEMDEYDGYAPHVLLRYRPANQVIGTVRLVLAGGIDPAACFPMEQVCVSSRLRQLPRHQTAEVSRFALSKSFRAASGTQSSLVRLALVRGILELSEKLDIRYWCALMEPKLLRLLQTSSIYFQQIGSMVDHHGLRQPSVLELSEMLARVRRERPEIWSFLTDAGRIQSEGHLEVAA